MVPMPVANLTKAMTAATAMIASSSLSHQVSRIRQFIYKLPSRLDLGYYSRKERQARQVSDTHFSPLRSLRVLREISFLRVPFDHAQDMLHALRSNWATAQLTLTLPSPTKWARVKKKIRWIE